MTRKGGRPTKYTAELAERALAVLRSGGSMAEAAGAAGVTAVTLHNWARVGRGGGRVTDAFASAYTEVMIRRFETRLKARDEQRSHGLLQRLEAGRARRQALRETREGRAVARASKYSEKLHKTLVAALAEGVPMTLATAVVGISPECVRLWLARGRRGEAPFDALVRDVEKAKAEAPRRILDRIREGHWIGLLALSRRGLPSRSEVGLTRRLVALIDEVEEQDRAAERAKGEG